MDGQMRSFLGRSLAAGASLATLLATSAPCSGQAPATTAGGPPVVAPRPSPTDRAVQRATSRHDFPSSQQAEAPSLAPPAKPLPALAPSPAPAAAPYTPAYAPQYAPQQYAPQQYAPQQYAPQYAMMVPVMPQPPQAAPGNFFLPNAAPAAPPAFAPPPPAMAPAYAMPMAPVPQPMAMAPALASSVSVPTSASKTSVEVRGPGMLASGLARFGERLTQLGRTRVRTIQETELRTPVSQPSGGSATISTLGMAPAQPQLAPPTAPPPEAAPEAPAPSPQGGGHAHPKHSMMRHLLGHD